MVPIVVVENSNPTPAGCIKSEIAALRCPQIRFVAKTSHSLVLGCVLSYGAPGGVGGSVVHNQEFQVALALLEDGFHGFAQEISAVPHSNHYRNKG
jgi:hypothetical protein